MKNEAGEITIPTILTVIVLIVLAGICIFMLTGENGLFVPKNYEQESELTNNSVIQENQTQNENNEVEDNEVLTVPVE